VHPSGREACASAACVFHFLSKLSQKAGAEGPIKEMRIFGQKICRKSLIHSGDALAFQIFSGSHNLVSVGMAEKRPQSATGSATLLPVHQTSSEPLSFCHIVEMFPWPKTPAGID
jgi:hypothetical protein